jgi:hypothetical protein
VNDRMVQRYNFSFTYLTKFNLNPKNPVDKGF